MPLFVYLSIALNYSTKLTSRRKVRIHFRMIILPHPLACVMHFLSLTEEMAHVGMCNRSAQFSIILIFSSLNVSLYTSTFLVLY
jgi:hypothetical protein